MSVTKYKPVEGVLDFSIDWSEELSDKFDTILTSVWESVPDITLTGDSFTGAVTTVFISGGTLGENYKIKNIITTDQGRTDSRYFNLKIADIQL